MKHEPPSRLFNHGEQANEASRKRRVGASGEAARGTRVPYRVRLSRDFSRLPQMESLLTYRQANESLARSLSNELDWLDQEN